MDSTYFNFNFNSHREGQNKSYEMYSHVKLYSVALAAPDMNPRIKKIEAKFRLQ
jgi:hypothetical protein